VTTVGLARMIKEAGIDFANLENEWFDMPFGYKTGAGVIFGASGGVMEAALRYALAELDPAGARSVKFTSLRESKVLRKKRLPSAISKFVRRLSAALKMRANSWTISKPARTTTISSK
jgi:iron only hydrogenase large subunit-like protein